MPGFTTSIVLAGVLIFIGGLIALGTQKARQMGAPFIISRIGSCTAALALLGAVTLAITGISAIGDDHEEESSDARALDRVLE